MPIFTALAVSALDATFAESAIGAFLIQTFAKVATSALVNLILGGDKSSVFGIQGKLQAGEDVPRGAPIGLCMTAGSLVYANTWGTSSAGTPNCYLVQVIALSDLPIKGLNRVMVNGEWATLGGTLDPAGKGYPVTDFVSGSSDFMWVKFYDGTQVTADSYLTSTFGSDANFPYDSGRVGTGIAYAIVTTRYNEALFQGFPEFKFEVQSIKLYDASKDTSVGGSGAQRWATPSTWGGDGDDLPIVQAYNIMRGISYAGAWVYGFQGTSQAQLPDADWIAQIAVCRTLVNWDATHTEYKYRAGGFLTFDTECGAALEQIMASCAGRIADNGGIYKPLAGTVGSTLATFTDDDLLSTEDAPFNPVKQLADTINGVTATYPDPNSGYEPKAATPYYRTDLEAKDQGRRLLASLTLNTVPYPYQVQRLQAALVTEVRRTRRHQITLSPTFWKVEPNDCVTWTSTRHGYTAKLFRVNAVVDQPDSSIVADIIEIDPTDYDYTYTSYVTPTYPVASPRAIRAHFVRNELMRWSDWLVVDDAYGRFTMSQQIRALAYRESVRNTNTQAGWPDTVTWPDELPDFTPLCDPINRLYEIRSDASASVLSAVVTTTRSTTGTLINARGYYDSAAANKARITYDPITGDIEGIICEGQATNACLQALSVGTSPWAFDNASATLNATKSPDGTVNASKILDNTTAGVVHAVKQAVTLTAGVKCWFKIHLKAAEYSEATILAVSTGMTNTSCVFNISTGAFSNLANSPDTFARELRDGWWEVNMSCTTVSSATVTFSVRMRTGGTTIFTGTGTSGIYAWGGDARVGQTYGYIIPTTTASVTRNADVHVTQLLASFFDPDKLSIYVEGKWFGGAALNSGLRPALSIDTSSSSNQIRVLNRTATPSGLQIEVGGSTVVAIDGTQSGTSEALLGLAARIYTNDVAVSTDGSSVQTDTSTSLPAFATEPIVRIGADFAGNYMNGVIRHIRLFRVLETDAQLEAMVR